jgi:hypothetical protein
MAPIPPGERQVFAQPRPTMIEDGTIVAAGFLTDCASQPTFAYAGRSDDILSRNSSSTFWSATRIIRGSGSASWWCARCAMPECCISS